MRNTIITLTVCAVVLTAPGRASAEEKDGGPAVQPTTRDGLTYGLAVGPGDFHVIPDVEGVDETILEGAAVSLRVGRALHQRALLMAIVEYVMTPDASHAILGIAFQTYLTKRVFLRAGGGFDVWHETEGEEEPPPLKGVRSHGGDAYEISLGGLGGVGVEFMQLRDLALSAELMIGAAMHPEVAAGDNNVYLLNVSLMLGVQWF
jgi:hypothetical protein